MIFQILISYKRLIGCLILIGLFNSCSTDLKKEINYIHIKKLEITKIPCDILFCYGLHTNSDFEGYCESDGCNKLEISDTNVLRKFNEIFYFEKDSFDCVDIRVRITISYDNKKTDTLWVSYSPEQMKMNGEILKFNDRISDLLRLCD